MLLLRSLEPGTYELPENEFWQVGLGETRQTPFTLLSLLSTISTERDSKEQSHFYIWMNEWMNEWMDGWMKWLLIYRLSSGQWPDLKAVHSNFHKTNWWAAYLGRTE